MNKKKILHLRSCIGFFGTENVIAELTRELAATKYQPIIGTFNNQKNPHLEMADFARQNNIESAVFECRKEFDLRTIQSIKNYIEINNIDIVHAYGYKADFYMTFATLFKKIPLVATCNPWITTTRRERIYAKIDQLLLKKFDRILTDSGEVKKELVKCKIPGNIVSVIDNGINIRRFEQSFNKEETRQKFGIPLASKVIGTAGRLQPEKGHLNLLLAAKKIIKNYPSAFFVIAGEGELKEELRNKAKELKLDDHVLIPGLVDSIPELLSMIDIFALPSLSEGLPMILLEAMAAKKPVIASAVGAVPTVITANASGILIPPGDIAALEREIVELLSNKEKGKKLAEAAYLKILNEYSSKRMAMDHVKIYNELMNGQV